MSRNKNRGKAEKFNRNSVKTQVASDEEHTLCDSQKAFIENVVDDGNSDNKKVCVSQIKSDAEHTSSDSQKVLIESVANDGNSNNKKVHVSLADKIQIVIACLTLLSVVAVCITVYTDYKATNMVYKPYIVMNPVNISFEWDSEGYQTWLTEVAPNINKKVTIDQKENNGEITGKIAIPLTILKEDTISKYSVVNIGVGTAKDLVFSWDSNNLSRINDYLIETDDKFIGFFEEGEEHDDFQIGDSLLFTNKIQDSALMYMLPQATDPWDLYFPVQYRILIEELIKHKSLEPKLFPLVILTVKYKDIQGKDYQQFIVVRVNQISCIENEDGSGKAEYQLTPTYEK